MFQHSRKPIKLSENLVSSCRSAILLHTKATSQLYETDLFGEANREIQNEDNLSKIKLDQTASTSEQSSTIFDKSENSENLHSDEESGPEMLLLNQSIVQVNDVEQEVVRFRKSKNYSTPRFSTFGKNSDLSQSLPQITEAALASEEESFCSSDEILSYDEGLNNQPGFRHSADLTFLLNASKVPLNLKKSTINNRYSQPNLDYSDYSEPPNNLTKSEKSATISDDSACGSSASSSSTPLKYERRLYENLDENRRSANYSTLVENSQRPISLLVVKDVTKSLYSPKPKLRKLHYSMIKDNLQTILTSINYLSAQVEGENLNKWQFIQTTRLFCQQLENASINQHLSVKTFSCVTHETSRLLSNSEDLSENYLLLCRNLIEAILKLILRCILDDISNAKYSFNNDNFNNHIELHQLPQALSQLTHVLLFDEEICAAAIQSGAVSSILQLCISLQVVPTKEDGPIVEAIQRYGLRCLAVLCAQRNACDVMMQHRGIPFCLTHITLSPSMAVCTEAASLLVQLTSPPTAVAMLPLTVVQRVVVRLLDLLSLPSSPHTPPTSICIHLACINNLCQLHGTALCRVMYERQTIRLLVRLAEEQMMEEVLEQICNIFTRMSTSGYIEALIAQGAIRSLLHMVTIEGGVTKDGVSVGVVSANDPFITDGIIRRIRYKAALCLATIAASSYGLQSIHQSDGSDHLQRAIRFDGPVAVICNNILAKIAQKYRLETFV